MRTRGVEAVHEVLAHEGGGARHHRCRHGCALQAGRQYHACHTFSVDGYPGRKPNMLWPGNDKLPMAMAAAPPS